MKRIIPLLLGVILLFPCLAVSVFATDGSDDIYSFRRTEYDKVANLYFCPEAVLMPDGLYEIESYVEGNVIDFFGEVLIRFSLSDGTVYPESCFVSNRFNISGFTNEFYIIIEPNDSEDMPGEYIMALVEEPGISGTFDAGIDAGYCFTLIESVAPSTPSPLSPVRESMTSVLEWVGTVATSLLSGELNPLLLLLAIPIAISLIFLAIKAIKMVFNF